MPPGLGVWIVNQACIDKSEYLRKRNWNIGAHHTLGAYEKNYQQFETPSTPNVMAIYILGKIAADMNETGIAQLRKDIRIKADLLYDFADAQEVFKPFVRNKADRSQTVAVLETTRPSSEVIANLKHHGIQIGSGYGKYKSSQIRIANFPATSIEDMQNLLRQLAVLT